MRNKKISIICSEFYSGLLDNLFIGVDKALDEFNSKKNTNISYSSNCVPGAFEIPGMIKYVLDNDNPDVIISLGVLIKGETAHFEYISNAVTNSISSLTIQSNIPIIFGVITAYDMNQAKARSDIKNIENNKGYQAMNTALYMLDKYERH